MIAAHEVPAWAEVVVLALNVAQVVALTWLARGQVAVRRKLNGDAGG